MVNSSLLREKICSGEFDEKLKDVYVDKSLLGYQRTRYVKAIDKFEQLFGAGEVEVFSAPGRSEICGNHTDHQRGKVLACAVNLDAIAIVSKREDSIVKIVSDSFDIKPIDIGNLEKNPAEEGTSEALVRGVLAHFREDGYALSGFNAYCTSDVLIGAGLSSSAAFEVLIGTIVSGMFNEFRANAVYIAIASQYAENVYFGKPCGLMDQMASSVGNLTGIDFEDINNPQVERINVDFDRYGYTLCIVDTKGSHADLTFEYAAVPKEMKEVASFFGKNVLREVPKEEFYSNINRVRAIFGDRAVLRAIHFYDDNERVEKEARALEKGDIDKFLKNVKKSGESSFQYLQNVYPTSNPAYQGVALCIALSRKIIGKNGVVRVHGGGFAGTMQAFVKNEFVKEYKSQIEKYFGEDSCYILKIRKYGGMKVI